MKVHDRVQRRAEALDQRDGTGVAALDPAWPEAQFAVVVKVLKVFPNCRRYIHNRALAARSASVRRAGVETPVPGWKRMDWAVAVLPSADAARSPPRG